MTASSPAARRTLIAALFTFGLLAGLVVSTERLLVPDALAHRALYDALGAGQQPLVWSITWLGNNATLVTAVTLLAVAFVVARRPEWAVRLVTASGGGALVITGLKMLFSRERPLEQIVEAAGWSFPSGHAFAATVFYGALVWIVWMASARPAVRWTAAGVATLVVLAVGLSRVYLNVHYLTDVVAGWAAGVAWLILSQRLAEAGLERWRQSRQTHSNNRNDAETRRPA